MKAVVLEKACTAQDLVVRDVPIPKVIIRGYVILV
jgi:hypothetical protein